MKARKLTIALGCVASALVLGSLAWAAVPDGNGVVHGCYEKSSGALRVTDTATNQPKACTNKEAALTWNQQGPVGPAGATGPQGPAGPAGVDPIARPFIANFGSDTGNAAPSPGIPCTLGEILLTASTTHSAGGVPAVGQLLPIGQNQALFALLGTTYGGDGKTTFALPDLRSMTPDHMTYSICTQGVWPA